MSSSGAAAHSALCASYKREVRSGSDCSGTLRTVAFPDFVEVFTDGGWFAEATSNARERLEQALAGRGRGARTFRPRTAPWRPPGAVLIAKARPSMRLCANSGCPTVSSR